MTTADSAVIQASFAAAASAVAGRVLAALRGDGEVGLGRYVDTSADATAALGAVRVVGADVFAAHVLLGRPLDSGDVGVVADSFAVFPPSTPEQGVAAWRDWATGRVCEVGIVSPPAESLPVVLGGAGSWQRWSIRVAQFSPLTLPRLGGPVTAAVAREPRALALGVTRAMLRRDYVTAARLARWVALLASMDIEPLLDPVLLVEHVRLHAGGDARLLLDLAVARHLLGLEPA